MLEFSNATAFPNAGRSRLALACVFSLLLHGLILATWQWLAAKPVQNRETPPPALQAVLVTPPPQAVPVLFAPPEPVAPLAAPAPKPLPQTRRPAAVTDMATLASRQIAQHLFYPPEAIADGLEGEAEVRLFLDGAGNAVAARLERSSGHAILDEAAVRAARAVRSLPAGIAQEVLLPVRFRLR